MRYLSFAICFSVSAIAFYLFQTPPTIITDVRSVATVPSDSQTVNVVQTPSRHDYLIWDIGSITYNGFLITNTKEGLTVRRNGKSSMFIKNEHDSAQIGRFGVKSLLGDEKEQLIYETRTGGNHCCIYQTIVDLSGTKPRTIFRSLDYDIQGGGDGYDTLGLFDADNDGMSEITQTETFYIEGASSASNPVIEIGFKYDKRARKYLSIRDFVPGQEHRIAKLKEIVAKANTLLKTNRQPEDLPETYDSSVIGIALNYIYADKADKGFAYLNDNYIGYNFENGSFVYDPKKSAKWAVEYKSDIERHLRKSRIYQVISHGSFLSN